MSYLEAEIKMMASLDEARKKLSELSDTPLTMEEVWEHVKVNPHGCEFQGLCDVCVAAGHAPRRP